MDFKLRIDKFLLDSVAVLGFPFELLQDALGRAGVDFLVAFKQLRRGERALEFCLHGNKLAFFCLLFPLPLSLRLILPMGNIRLPGVSLALLAAFTST